MFSREFLKIYRALLECRIHIGRANMHNDEATMLITGHHPFWCRIGQKGIPASRLS